MDTPSKVTGVASLVECQAACAASQTCKWWTHEAGLSNCFLFTGTDTLRANDDCTSGPVACEGE